MNNFYKQQEKQLFKNAHMAIQALLQLEKDIKEHKKSIDLLESKIDADYKHFIQFGFFPYKR